MDSRVRHARTRLGLALAVLGVAMMLGALWPAPATPSNTPVEAREPSPQPSLGRDGPASIAPLWPEASQGQALFIAKGCATCHRHAAVTTVRSLSVGPDLSRYVPDPDFVRRWLRDPAAVRPATAMPNLGLRTEEIEALIAFLESSGRSGS